MFAAFLMFSSHKEMGQAGKDAGLHTGCRHTASAAAQRTAGWPREQLVPVTCCPHAAGTSVPALARPCGCITLSRWDARGEISDCILQVSSIQRELYPRSQGVLRNMS